MAEVLAKVKRDLGPNAVILHTRTIRKGGVMGVGGRTLVEVTASADARALAKAERRAVVGSQTQASSKTKQAINQIPPVKAQAAYSAVESTTPKPSTEISSLTSALRGEMKELRSMVRELLDRPAGDARAAMPEELQKMYSDLLASEVADEVAREVINEAKHRLGQLQSALQERCRANNRRTANGSQKAPHINAKKALHDLVPVVAAECIERMLPKAEPLQLQPNGGTKFVAFVGPTGVGKTTTIAKLAAQFKLREKCRVAMITIDTYRIAAVDQLRAYADILDVPLQVVLTPQEMAAAIQRMRDVDLVLIDTAGRSQRNKDRLHELRAFLEAARKATAATREGNEHRLSAMETYLVLSCTTRPDQMVEVAKEFSFLGLDRVVFTKLDEAVGLGVILNVAKKLDLQLSYLTTGQEVPDDIEVGNRRRIAELILNRNAPAQPPKAEISARVGQLA
jgi:flagellar biosynthesis protein FlhF